MRKRQRPLRPLRPLKRAVHIGGEPWTYSVGSTTVRIRPPDQKATHTVSFCVLLGITDYDIERARWKGGNYANVTPSVVKRYIQEALVGKASV